MNWKQFLTEKVLGEEWLEPPPNHRDTCSCYECVDCRTYNRTFDNRSDLMDLYERIWRLNKWTYLMNILSSRLFRVIGNIHERIYYEEGV